MPKQWGWLGLLPALALLAACGGGGGGGGAAGGGGDGSVGSLAWISARGSASLMLGDHSLAVITVGGDHTLWGVGSNASSELGIDGNDAPTLYHPQQIGVDTDWKAAWVGRSHSLGLKQDGSLWAWGSNTRGELGDDCTVDETCATQVAPAEVCDPDTAPECTELTGVKMAGVGANGGGSISIAVKTNAKAPPPPPPDAFSVALLDDGRVLAWGDNTRGQLGNGCLDSLDTPCATNSLPQPVCIQWDGFTCTELLTNVVSIAVGDGFVVALDAAGAVWAWGDGTFGQLGDGNFGAASLNPLAAPVCVVLLDGPCLALTGVVQIAAGSHHALALRDDGSVWAWGLNNQGQVGDGKGPKTDPISRNTTLSAVAVPVCRVFDAPKAVCTATLGNVASIAATGKTSFAVLKDGTLWGWGSDAIGQLGDGRNGNFLLSQAIGSTADLGLATQLGGASGWSSRIAGGDVSTLFAKSDGTVLAAGWNLAGSVGLGDWQHSVPTRVPGADGAAPGKDWAAGDPSLAAGFLHSLARKADGSLFAWGWNGLGMLGTEVAQSYAFPQATGNTNADTPPDQDWIAVAAGELFTLALKKDGTVWAWGDNSVGQLGDGCSFDPKNPTCVSSPTPKEVCFPDGDGGCIATPGITSIAAGKQHAMAIGDAGATLWLWGDGSAGQLGNACGIDVVCGPVSTPAPVAFELPAGFGWVAVDGGDRHTVAVLRDAKGILYRSWGDNTFGQLGDGTFVAKSSAGVVCESFVDNICTPLRDSGAFRLSVRGNHNLLVRPDTSLWAWGANASGQLGDGCDPNTLRDCVDATLPQPVCANDVCQQLSGVQSVAAGGAHSLALLGSGILLAWGDDSRGQLGDGCNLQSNSRCPAASLPQQVGDDNGWRGIAAGYQHNLARKADGSLWAWGYNIVGQLGDGTAFRDKRVQLYP